MSWFASLLSRSVQPQADDARVLSRRAFFTGGFLRQAAAPAPARPRPVFPVLRPPGTVGEADFLAGCTRCGDCIRACPHQAIRLAPDRLRAAAGTPIIDPAVQPCLMCTDTPCITACTPAVLRRAPDTPVPAIGLARIATVDCLAHQGTTCTTCSERCPVEGAIRLTGSRPQVVPDVCTGCGICHHVCPAPRNAVLVMPRARS